MPISARQRFVRRHRTLGMTLLALVGLLNLVLAATLSPRQLIGGAAVGVFFIVYLWLNRKADRTRRWLPSKIWLLAFSLRWEPLRR